MTILTFWGIKSIGAFVLYFLLWFVGIFCLGRSYLYVCDFTQFAIPFAFGPAGSPDKGAWRAKAHANGGGALGEGPWSHRGLEVHGQPAARAGRPRRRSLEPRGTRVPWAPRGEGGGGGGRSWRVPGAAGD